MIRLDWSNDLFSVCAVSFIFFIDSVDDKDQKKSQKVLAELENIDDECDQNDIAFVKIDDDKEAEEWGIDEIPTIVSEFELFFFLYLFEWFEMMGFCCVLGVL